MNAQQILLRVVLLLLTACVVESKEMAAPAASRQAGEGVAVVSPEAPPTSTDGAGAAPTLYAGTLLRDIETAGFYELVAWLEGLNLSTVGDRDALARRLMDHYGLEGSVTAEGESANAIVVDSAARTRYFTLADIDERYVRLSGGVTIELRDTERDVVHQVVADEVTYNQDLNVLSASGDVIYTLDRSGTVEQFFGDALTVQLDDWNGAFVRGVTQRARTIEGEQVDFSFAGSYITRSSDDVVVMENGRITSSVATPPNYEIRADKIWVLAPGEWGLRNAFLYVGRVPVFYFPFFFRPGDRLFFNPSVGVRDREGNYIQTTTYLLGKPEKPNSAFSFLQIAEEDTGTGSQEIKGLYLVPKSDAPPDAPPNPSVLRLLTDLYSKLGAYVALDGSFPELGPVKNLAAYLGLGMTRNLYQYAFPERGTTYSPYYLSGGDAVTYWNSTRIGPLRIPFRFGLGLSAAIGGSAGTLNGDLTFFSDRQFKRDFDRRSEQIDWLGLLGQGTPLAEPPLVTGFDWNLRATLSPQMPTLAPWIQQAALQNVSASLQWRERTIDTLPDAVASADASPEVGFFYPNSLQAPNVSGIVSGQLLSLSSAAPPEPEGTPLEATPLRQPWSEVEFAPLDAEDTLRIPSRLSSIPPAPIPDRWNMSLGYTVSPTALIEHSFNGTEWSEPEDVDFSLAYSAASGRVVATMPLSVSLLSSAVGLTGSLSTNGQYRTVFNRSASMSDAEWETLQAQSYSYSSANATGSFTARLTPFASSPYWSQSSFAYTINLTLYQLLYSEAEGTGDPPYLSRWIDWSEEFIRTHQLQATAVLDLIGQQSLRATLDLPPHAWRLTGQMDLSVAPVSLSIASGIAQEDDLSWTVQPISSAQAVALGEGGRIQNQVSYDVDQRELTSDSVSATLGPIRANVDMRSSNGYDFGGAGVGWVDDGVRAFRATGASLSASLERELDPLWRNRLLISGKLDSSWSMNLLRYTEGTFTFNLQADVEVTDFLTLSLSSQSVNSQTYVYVAPLAEGVGRSRRSLAGDLLRSFNVFKRQDRLDSAFNLQQIQLTATHYLEDWDLNVRYAGRPAIVLVADETTGGTRREYDWQSSLDIELQWHAIRELSSNIRADNQTPANEVVTGNEWELTFGNDS